MRRSERVRGLVSWLGRTDQGPCGTAQRTDQRCPRGRHAGQVLGTPTGAPSQSLSAERPTVRVITAIARREHDERGTVAARGGAGGEVVQLLVRVPPELADELKATAAAEDRSVAATVRQALREYLADRQPAPAEPEQLRMTGT